MTFSHDLLLAHGLLLVTPPDVPTHISGNVIDLGLCSPSLFMAVDATVDSSLCVGSDHLPIHYSLNFEVTISKSTKFNAEKMDCDAYHSIIGNRLAALDGSTPRHHPCPMARKWRKPLLTTLRTTMRNKPFYHAIAQAKLEVWIESVVRPLPQVADAHLRRPSPLIIQMHNNSLPAQSTLSILLLQEQVDGMRHAQEEGEASSAQGLVPAAVVLRRPTLVPQM
ncbi:hypothetical protein B0H14DRAFT_3535371 [Mycena olivaceomarginata]|nr:hypothetical protein B0H14DRAFT_3535371 [Mycena olivaceomarginata]